MRTLYSTDGTLSGVKMIGALTDGEIACCCSPPDCCLYPWSDPDGTAGGPYYPPEDLPDAIHVSVDVPYVGVLIETINRDSGAYSYTGTYFKVKPDTGGGSQDWLIVTAAYNIGGSGLPDGYPFGNQNCLIGGYGAHSATVADQFSDTYTVTFYGPSGSIATIVTRTGLCQWDGVTANGAAVFLTYVGEGDNMFSRTFWEVRLDNSVQADVTILGTNITDHYKYVNVPEADPSDNNSAPDQGTGIYDGGIAHTPGPVYATVT